MARLCQTLPSPRGHTALESLLGGSAPVRYVQIAEVHADGYGYDGLTAE
jgi:hypothetical protein